MFEAIERPALPCHVLPGPATIPLEPGAGLAARIRELCIDLEYGAAEVLDLVTPTTRTLLHWWFGIRPMEAREGFNFDTLQRQAILNLIVAHEVLCTEHLLGLYGQLARGEPFDAPNYPRYCLYLPQGVCDATVLAALLVWQLANQKAADAGPPASRAATMPGFEPWSVEDRRFTRHLLVVAPDTHGSEALQNALGGPFGAAGPRDFAGSLPARQAELLLPPALREDILYFIRNRLAGDAEAAEPDFTPSGGVVAVTERQQLAGARGPAEWLASVPDLMVFNFQAHHAGTFSRSGLALEVPWQIYLNRFARGKVRRFAQVDLLGIHRAADTARRAQPFSETRPTQA